MTTMNVKDASGATVAIEKPLAPGTAADSASRPVAFSTEGKAQLGATNETAATALNSTVGLNGLIRGLWTAFGLKTDAKSTATDTTSVSAISVWKQISASVQLMVFGAGTAAAAQRTTLASDDPAVATLGATTGTKVVTDANGTVQQYLRGLVTFFANALGAGTAAAANRVTLASDDPAVATIGSTTGTKVVTDANGTLQQYLRGIVSLLVSGITVASHAVTNAGTFAVQSTLQAGSALVGKFGIDQTTDGTTNRVTPPVTIPVILTGTFTPGTSYAIGNSIGGKIAVATGLSAGAIVHVQEIQIRIGAGTFTAGSAVSISYHLYESDPSASTVTDAAAFIENSADAVKLVATAALSALPGQVAANEAATWAVGPARALTVGSGGNIYLVLVAAGTFTMTGPYAAWRVELRK